MKRLFFALYQGWKYHVALQGIRHRHLCLDSVCALTPAILQSRGITHLILDFDGVLAGHGEPLPCTQAQRWLDAFAWPRADISILSNKPLPVREAYFQDRYPGISFIRNVAKKPYPAGLLQCLSTQHLAADAVALVDDRLLTGVLAALQVGVQVVYIEQPYRSTLDPMSECFFAILRWLERGLYKIRPLRMQQPKHIK